VDFADPAIRILVVEDHAVNQRITCRFLELLGLTCDVATNGREAVEWTTRQAYDLVLMDCQMPEMDGYEATRAIRFREGLGRRVPVIAVTADAMEGTRQRCLQAGMDDYISKPLKKDELHAMLRKWLAPALVDWRAAAAATPQAR
jgi:CheY-like chemotaxis protein